MRASSSSSSSSSGSSLTRRCCATRAQPPSRLLLWALLAAAACGGCAGAEAAAPARRLLTAPLRRLQAAAQAGVTVSFSSSSMNNAITTPRQRPPRQQLLPGGNGTAAREPALDSRCPRSCPSAWDAAQALIGDDPHLSVASARLTACTVAAAKVPNAAFVTDFGGSPFEKSFGETGALVLSSGNAATLCPHQDQAAFGFDVALGGQPDAQWAEVVGHHTDATVLEFDLVSRLPGSVSLQYAFASAEVFEAQRPLNDGFGAFLGGANRAAAPGSVAGEPALHSAATLRNLVLSPLWYTDHSGLLATQALEVATGSPVHVKLVVADTGDSFADSWVLLKRGSLRLQTVAVCSPLDGPCCGADGQFLASSTVCEQVDDPCQRDRYCSGASAACAGTHESPLPEGQLCAWPAGGPAGAVASAGPVLGAAPMDLVQWAALDSSQRQGLTTEVPQAARRDRFSMPACAGRCLAGRCHVKMDAGGCRPAAAPPAAALSAEPLASPLAAVAPAEAPAPAAPEVVPASASLAEASGL